MNTTEVLPSLPTTVEGFESRAVTIPWAYSQTWEKHFEAVLRDMDRQHACAANAAGKIATQLNGGGVLDQLLVGIAFAAWHHGHTQGLAYHREQMEKLHAEAAT